MLSRRFILGLAVFGIGGLLAPMAEAKSSPYGGKPVPVPGIVQAENFDLGGDNVGYHTKDNVNHLGQYRLNEGVSLEKSTDAGGGYNVGWARAGDWLNYTIKVDKAGDYTIHTRVACVGAGGTFHYKLDFVDATAQQKIPDTGGWQNWVTLTTTIHLPAGRHVLQLHEDTPGADSNGDVGNFNWIKIKKGGAGDDGRQKLLNFLNSTSGVATVVGMHNKYSSTPHSYTDENDAIAGRPSALWGGDFLFGDQAQYRGRMIAEAKAQYAKGALVALTYHACSPKRDERCEWDEIGGDNHAQLSDEEFRQLTTPGTGLYNSWIGRLDTLATYFQQLKEAGVAVVFRPLHEMNQCVFWWACHTGPNGSARLYQITHDYLTNTKGLNNIVWAWNVQDFTASMPGDLNRYDPGAAYYDVVTLDIYESAFRQDFYDAMVSFAKGKPIAVGEVQYMPTADKLRQQPKWAWVMQWSDFIYDNDHMIANLYAAPNVTTLDEMPGW